MEPLVSIIIPSRNRIEGLSRSLKSVIDTTNGHSVEILVVLDRPDVASQQFVKPIVEAGLCKIVLMPESYRNGHPQEKWQAGYAASNGSWIAMITDDIEMHPGWLDACLEFPNAGFIGFNDPNWMGMLATLLMASRDYIEVVMHGRFGLPWYYVEWADNEWTERARIANALAFCPGAKFTHYRTPDSQRDLTASQNFPAKDAETFKARLAAGFPDNWPVV